MRVHFDAVRRPARVAKSLRAELERLGVKVGLARAQDLVAEGFGYASYRELQAVCGKRPADAWDEDSPEAVVAARRARQVEAYASAGIGRDQAEAIVDRLRPSSRQACKGSPLSRGTGKEEANAAPVKVSPIEPARLSKLDHDDPKKIAHLVRAPSGKEGPGSVLLEDGWLLCATSDPEGARAEGERLRGLGVTVSEIRYDVAAFVAAFGAGLSDPRSRQCPSIGIPAARERLRRVFREALRGGSGHVTILRGPSYEPESSVIRFRVDGVDRPVTSVSHATAEALQEEAFRLAWVSFGACYDRPGPHAGRMDRSSGLLPNGIRTARCQWIPLPDGGTQLDVRLFDARPVGSVATYAYPEHAEAAIARMRRRPAGLNLVVGPAQSGKSICLASILAQDPGASRRLVAIDDGTSPPIPGAIQVLVQTGMGDPDLRLDAHRGAIDSALSLDPDILSIGEIAHARIAQAAFDAAMSGIQVWATIRATGTYAALDRLRDLGIERHRILDPTLVTGLVGQRLVRRTCENCSIGYGEAATRLPPDAIEAVGRLGDGRVPARLRFANPEGCRDCREGFKGRQLVAEAILPNDDVFGHLGQGRKELATHAWRHRSGGRTMLEDAFRQVLSGDLDIREVETRVGFVEDLPPAIRSDLREILDGTWEAPEERTLASATVRAREAPARA